MSRDSGRLPEGQDRNGLGAPASQNGGAISAASPNLEGIDSVIERCPFCRGEAFLKAPKGMFSDQTYRGCCTKCGAEGPYFYEATCATPDESAIAAWNARPLSPPEAEMAGQANEIENLRSWVRSLEADKERLEAALRSAPIAYGRPKGEEAAFFKEYARWLDTRAAVLLATKEQPDG